MGAGSVLYLGQRVKITLLSGGWAVDKQEQKRNPPINISDSIPHDLHSCMFQLRFYKIFVMFSG
jgi:hypothetical protein